MVLCVAVAEAQPQPPAPPASLIPPLPTGTPPPAMPDAGGPRMQFASPVHDFGRIVSGSSVRHEFIFTNVGSATLYLSNVVASCGCTTAGQWSRAVEPGQTGSIPIQFNSGGFQGMIFKTVTVHSNDRQQPTTTLQLKGDIWKPVEVNPMYAILHANSETLTQARASVRIINHEDTPLTVQQVQSINPVFTVELRTNQPGTDYELLVAASPSAPPGNAQGVITLRTSSTNAPLLNVTAMLVVQPAVVVAPQFIHLPSVPLPTPQTVMVNVLNNGTNSLVLSNAQVNVAGVSVQVREVTPGRTYSLAVTFPAGFDLEPGQNAVLTAQSSHPQFPQFQVPIRAASRRQATGLVAPPPLVPVPQPASPPPQPVPARPAARSLANARPPAAPSELPPMPPGNLVTNRPAVR